MSDGEKVSSLDAAYAEIARLETFALHLVAGLDDTGYAHDVGAGTTARFLTLRYRIDATKARRDVNLANALPKYPIVAAALPDTNPQPITPADTDAGDDDAGDSGAGDSGAGVGVLLHPAQAAAIVSALEKVPDTVPVDDVRVAEERLVELGRTHGPFQLRDAGKLFRDRLDTDGPEPAEQAAYDREALKLRKADNGVAFTGYLANENAELFRTLIHAHAKPRKTIDGALDPRGRDKRQADALTTILATATNPTAGDPIAMVAEQPARGPVAVDDLAEALPGMPTDEESTATAITGHSPAEGPAHGAAQGPAENLAHAAVVAEHGAGHGPARSPAQGEGQGRSGGCTPGHAPKAHITVTIDFNDLKAATADKIGHLIYGDALSAATIRRLACDAQIVPVVLGSQSQPLDVGTSVRLATGPMRKALIARDKGCVCCGAPPIYCDAHHVVSWIDGGETKITNLALICRRCHRDLHAGHWDIHITNGVVHVARPAWATPTSPPRGKYRPPTTTPVPTESTPGAATAGAPTRVWPRDTDPPWLTSEEAARLNPWGEAPGEPNASVGSRPPVAGFDPWGERSDDGGPRGISKQKTGKGTPAPGVDVWGDTVSPTVHRHSNSGTDARGTFDPWGDVAPKAADALNPEDADPITSGLTADPSSGSTQPGDATATTAA